MSLGGGPRLTVAGGAVRTRIDRQLSEEHLQRAVLEHLRLRAPKDVIYFHVPNQGKRGGDIEVARLKGLGMVSGIPDLILGRHGRMCALELKARGRKPSNEQEAVMDWFRAASIPVAWADNLDDALEHLTAWGFFRKHPNRERMILDPDEEG